MAEPSAAQVVRALAGWTAPIDNRWKCCALCLRSTNGMVTDAMNTPGRHREDCPWRQAREWATRNPSSPEEAS
jgi:hypothetical protein